MSTDKTNKKTTKKKVTNLSKTSNKTGVTTKTISRNTTHFNKNKNKFQRNLAATKYDINNFKPKQSRNKKAAKTNSRLKIKEYYERLIRLKKYQSIILKLLKKKFIFNLSRKIKYNNVFKSKHKKSLLKLKSTKLKSTKTLNLKGLIFNKKLINIMLKKNSFYIYTILNNLVFKLKLKQIFFKLPLTTKNVTKNYFLYRKKKGRWLPSKFHFNHYNKFKTKELNIFDSTDITSILNYLNQDISYFIHSYIQHNFLALNILDKQLQHLLYVNVILGIFKIFKYIFLSSKNLNLLKNKIRVKKNKSWFILKNKLFKLKLEKFLFNTLNIKSYVYLEKINRSLGFIKRYVLPPKSSYPRWLNKFHFFNELSHLFFFALHLKSTNLLAVFISRNITNNKRHFNFLKRAKLVLSILFTQVRQFRLRGILISVHGKFQGHLRKRRFKLALGSAGMSTFNTIIDYDFRRSYTRWGVFSIKVFFFFNNYLILKKYEKKKIERYYKIRYMRNSKIKPKRRDLLLKLKNKSIF